LKFQKVANTKLELTIEDMGTVGMAIQDMELTVVELTVASEAVDMAATWVVSQAVLKVDTEDLEVEPEHTADTATVEFEATVIQDMDISDI